MGELRSRWFWGWIRNARSGAGYQEDATSRRAAACVATATGWEWDTLYTPAKVAPSSNCTHHSWVETKVLGGGAGEERGSLKEATLLTFWVSGRVTDPPGSIFHFQRNKILSWWETGTWKLKWLDEFTGQGLNTFASQTANTFSVSGERALGSSLDRMRSGCMFLGLVLQPNGKNSALHTWGPGFYALHHKHTPNTKLKKKFLKYAFYTH